MFQKVTILFCLASFVVAGNQIDAQETAAERVKRATKNVANKQKFKLEYKLNKNETIRWTVEHVAETKTQMAGETEETSMRSETTNSWRIASVDSLGNITFVHSIEAVNMWHKVGEADPVSYDSESKKEIPEEYKAMADNVGKPLTIFSITPDGEITDRKSSRGPSSFGTGEVTLPLPKTAIPVGFKWRVALKDLQASDEDGRTLYLKAQTAYELLKVKSGKAYISFATQILTPVESQKVKSQIMQQKTKGIVVFDIAKGRPIHKEVEWNETVQGFQGPDSFLQYIGKLTERLAVGGAANGSQSNLLAPLNSTKVANNSVDIKTRESKPVMRK